MLTSVPFKKPLFGPHGAGWEGERDATLSRKTCLSSFTVCPREWDIVGSTC